MRKNIRVFQLMIILYLAEMNNFMPQFILFYLRELLLTSSTILFWIFAFNNNPLIGEYSKYDMPIYIIFIALMHSLINSTSLNGLAWQVYSGAISNYLTKPVSLVTIWLGQEVANKTINLISTLVELTIIVLLIKPPLTQYLNWPRSFLLLLLIIIGMALSFQINILFGSLGFYTNEHWSIRFLYYVLMDTVTGRHFPLNLLPTWLAQIINLSPFVILGYGQSQIFLNKADFNTVLTFFLTGIIWNILLLICNLRVWQQGLRDYHSHGG